MADTCYLEGADEFHKDDEEIDETSHKKLLNAVSLLYRKQRIAAPKRNEPSEQISEFNLTKLERKKKLVPTELLKGLTSKSVHHQIRNKVQAVQRRLKPLPKPLEKFEAEKITRETGYETVSKELSKWEATIQKHRAADQLTFPLRKDGRVQMELERDILSTFSKPTDLEMKMAEVLNKSPFIQELKEEAEPEKLTLAQVLQRRNMIAKMRARESYRIAKAVRQNKIKSKKYHRMLKRDRIRKELKEFELLQKTDPEAALAKLERVERARAEERITLRHRNTGKWAKGLAIRSKYDAEARAQLAENLRKSRELTQKIKASMDSDSEDVDDEAELDIPDKSAENPWVNRENEVASFVKGYRRYWEEQNKALALGPAAKKKDASEPANRHEESENESDGEEGMEKNGSERVHSIQDVVETKGKKKNRTKKREQSREKTENKGVDRPVKQTQEADKNIGEEQVKAGKFVSRVLASQDDACSKAGAPPIAANLDEVDSQNSTDANISDLDSVGGKDVSKTVSSTELNGIVNGNEERIDSENEVEVTSTALELPSSTGSVNDLDTDSSEDSDFDASDIEIIAKQNFPRNNSPEQDHVSDELDILDYIEDTDPSESEDNQSLSNSTKSASHSETVVPTQKTGLSQRAQKDICEMMETAQSNASSAKKMSNSKRLKNGTKREVSICDRTGLWNVEKISSGEEAGNRQKKSSKLKEDVSKKNEQSKAEIAKVVEGMKPRKKRQIEDIFEEAEIQIGKSIPTKIAEARKRLQKKGPKASAVHDGTEGERTSKKRADFEDLSFKKSRVEVDTSLVEVAHEGISSGMSDVQKIMDKVGKAIAPQETKLPDIDPNKFIPVKTQRLNTAISELEEGGDSESDEEEEQRMNLMEAFADDDIADEFRREKEEAEEGSKPKTVDLRLPGWGSWGGVGLVPQDPKNKRYNSRRKGNKKVITFPGIPRKDQHKKLVIINDEPSIKFKKQQVDDLPLEFPNVAAFESSIRAPIGDNWVPQAAHVALTAPPVMTKMGAIIEPIDESHLLKEKEEESDKLGKTLRGTPSKGKKLTKGFKQNRQRSSPTKSRRHKPS